MYLANRFEPGMEFADLVVWREVRESAAGLCAAAVELIRLKP